MRIVNSTRAYVGGVGVMTVNGYAQGIIQEQVAELDRLNSRVAGLKMLNDSHMKHLGWALEIYPDLEDKLIEYMNERDARGLLVR